jgi:hypothetical protein
MRVNLHITFDNGKSKEITASAADLVAFEDKFNLSVAKLGDDPRMSYLLFLAWHSEKRTKGTELSYEDWLGTVSSIGDGESDPKSEG